MKQCSYCGRENTDDAIHCSGCGQREFVPPVSAHQAEQPAVTASGSKQETSNSSRVTCPTCGAAGNYRLAVQPTSSFNLLALLGGGILALIFFNVGRRRRVLCNKCEKGFYIRSPLSKVSLVIFWLLVSPTILMLAGWLVYMVFTTFLH